MLSHAGSIQSDENSVGRVGESVFGIRDDVVGNRHRSDGRVEHRDINSAASIAIDGVVIKQQIEGIESCSGWPVGERHHHTFAAIPCVLSTESVSCHVTQEDRVGNGCHHQLATIVCASHVARDTVQIAGGSAANSGGVVAIEQVEQQRQIVPHTDHIVASNECR